MSGNDKEKAKPTLEECFADCKTGRVEQARALTNLLLNKHARLDNPANRRKGEVNTFALNVDASWGMGKTFFIERWAQYLKGQGHLTLMFNAWQHDHSKDAMTSLLSGLYRQVYLSARAMQDVDEKKQKVLDQIGEVGEAIKGIFKRTLPATLGNLSKATLGVNLAELLSGDPDDSKLGDVAREFIGSLGSAVGQEMLESARSYEGALDRFVDAMNTLVGELKEINMKLPIFVFIDDLDRCRPDFSIEILECVKHVLEINSVYFVFTTDAEQLQYSIKAIYGVEFDSEKYLKRIFNRDCILMPADGKAFTEYLFADEVSPVQGLKSNENILIPGGGKNVNESMQAWFYLITRLYDLDLRSQMMCRDLLVDVLDIRRDQLTPYVVLVHLIVLWHKDRKVAEDQSKSKILLRTEWCDEGFSIDEARWESRAHGVPTRMKITEVIRRHYLKLGKTYSDLVFSEKRQAESALRVVDGIMARYASSADNSGICFDNLMTNIKLISQ